MLSVEQVAADQIRPLRRVEYDRLVQAGVFDGERLELLRGRLVLMGPQYAPHSSTVARLNDLFVPRLMGLAQARVQLPLALSDDSEPEPDVAVVALGDYDEEHPHTAMLVIEVSESSLKKDRQLKPAIYAEAGIPDYWIVNLVDRTIEVHRDPQNGRYQNMRARPEGEAVIPLAFPDLSVEVTRVLPRKR